MNTEEKRVAKRTAAIIRSARKHKGLTQLEVGQALGASQANISKLESALLIPSAIEWFEFCSITGISPESIRTGVLDRKEPVVLRSDRHESGIALPKAYVKNRASKIRAVMPFVRYFQASRGPEKLAAFLEVKGVDEDLFVDLDNQISLAFTLDLVRELAGGGSLKPEDVRKLAGAAGEASTHGVLWGDYPSSGRTTPALVRLIRNAKYYEGNFGYEIEDSSRKEVVLSVSPREHLSELEYRRDPVLGDFLCEYKRAYFQCFSEACGGGSASLTEAECHFHGADRCVYRFKLPA